MIAPGRGLHAYRPGHAGNEAFSGLAKALRNRPKRAGISHRNTAGGQGAPDISLGDLLPKKTGLSGRTSARPGAPRHQRGPSTGPKHQAGP